MLKNPTAKEDITKTIREKQQIITDYKTSSGQSDSDSIDALASDIRTVFDRICDHYADIVSSDTFLHELTDVKDDGNPSDALNQLTALVLEFSVFSTSWFNTAQVNARAKIRLQLDILGKAAETVRKTARIARGILDKCSLATKSDLYILFVISAMEFSKNIANTNSYLPDDPELNAKTVDLHCSVVELLEYAFSLKPEKNDRRYLRDCVREQFGYIRVLDPDACAELKRAYPEMAPKPRILPILTVLLTIAVIILYFIIR